MLIHGNKYGEKNLLKSGGMEDQDTDEMITLKRTKTILGTVTKDKKAAVVV
jgi:hypothetical protein